MKYAIMVFPLSKQDGGGFVGVVPDLPGCMSDGETAEEAARNAQDAIADWVGTAKKLNRKIPKPGAAIKKAKAASEKVIEAIHALQSLDERLNELAADVKELREIQENATAWQRFVDITVLPASKAKSKRQTVDC